MDVPGGEGMRQGAWTARSTAMLDALVSIEAAAIRRVQAPSRLCGHFTSSL